MYRQYDPLYPASSGSVTRAQRPVCPHTVNKIDTIAPQPSHTVICTNDYWQLQEHRRRYEQLGSNKFLYLARLIRTKSSSAKVVSFDELPEGVVTGNALISFSIDGNRSETRSLYHWNYPTHARGVPMRSLLGITLLGMRAGQRAKVVDREDTTAEVQVLAVHAPLCQSGTHCV